MLVPYPSLALVVKDVGDDVLKKRRKEVFKAQMGSEDGLLVVTDDLDPKTDKVPKFYGSSVNGFSGDGADVELIKEEVNAKEAKRFKEFWTSLGHPITSKTEKGLQRLHLLVSADVDRLLGGSEGGIKKEDWEGSLREVLKKVDEFCKEKEEESGGSGSKGRKNHSFSVNDVNEAAFWSNKERFRPAEFLEMKKEILVNYKRKNGQMSRRDTRDLFKKDVNKIGKVYDLMKGEGYLSATLNGWQPQDGIGYPGDEYRVMENVAPTSSSKAMSVQNSAREEAQSQAHAKRSANPSHSISSSASRAGILRDQEQHSSMNDEEALQVDALLSLSRSSTRLSDLSGSPLTSIEEASFSHDNSSRSTNVTDSNILAGTEADKNRGNQFEAEVFQPDPAYGIGMKEEVNELHRINRSRTIGASIDNTIDEISISNSPLRLNLNLGLNFQEEGSLKSNASRHNNPYYERNNGWKSSSSDLSLEDDPGLEME